MLATDCDSTRIVYHYLKDFFSIEKVIIERSIGRKEILKRRIKKLGYIKVAGQLFFQVLVTKALAIFSKNRIREIIQEKKLNVSTIDSNKVYNVSNINEPEVAVLINQIDPDVVLVNGTRIISKNVLQAVRKHFINTHLGITPACRGVHGGYWALTQKDAENFGATIHLIDSGIDTGQVLYKVKASHSKKDNFISYPYLQIAAALDPIRKSIVDVCNNTLGSNNLQLNGQSKLWYHPTIGQYLYNRIFKGVK